MKRTRPKPVARPAPFHEVTELRARLAEADETLRAIRNGEVDTVMGAGKKGAQRFTLEGADHAYRMLIESMNEGALTLTADKTILYANQCFARMVKSPLEQVIGSSLRRFLSVEDREKLRELTARPGKSNVKIQAHLLAANKALLPVQISVRSLGGSGPTRAAIGVVLTDMTEARENEERLRSLTQRVVQVQEAERGSVAGDLHDHITQLLCAILFRCQALVVELSAAGGPSMVEAVKLRGMLGKTAEEVERISSQLRPSVLDQLGLDSVLRAATTEFARRVGVAVKLTCVDLAVRLPEDTELALYRILQEALRNVERHTHARQVSVALTHDRESVRLTIKDDGIGFNVDRPHSAKGKKDAIGLLGMRERATYVGGTLTVTSGRRTGTTIVVRVPLPVSALPVL